jgi:UDP-N-acetylmuramoyl-tripeptide--D-alanyl-D-alanine ligase
VIAVGGSNGKTSTKELIRAALSSRLEVHATTGNLNNQIGVPQTLLALDDSADVAVIEVGTNMPGEIELLRKIVRPDIAVVTAIEEEHLEGFGDLAGVLREEASLLDGVPLAIVPAHEIGLVTEARTRAQSLVRAGVGEGDVAATSGALMSDGTGRLEIEGGVVRVPLRGEHNMRNAMLAVAVARACGISLDDAARGIAALDPSAMPGMRSAVEQIGDALLVNDCYNANPGSARAALKLLAAVAGDRPRVIVLGTMRELGAQAAAAHREIAQAAVASGATIIAGMGEFAAALRDVAPRDERVIAANDVDDLWPVLERRLTPTAAILLKASRGVKLERIVPHLREWAADPSPYRTA